jgi:hypothetical protein
VVAAVGIVFVYLCGMVRRGDQEGASFLSNPVRRGNNSISVPTHFGRFFRVWYSLASGIGGWRHRPPAGASQLFCSDAALCQDRAALSNNLFQTESPLILLVVPAVG